MTNTMTVNMTAQFLSILTNDAWWGNTQGHKQLLSYARLRAIENRRAIARSANTGISAFIDAQGRMSPCCWLGGRQQDFVTNFEQVQQSWTSLQPNITCLDACGTTDGASSFTNQWQRTTQLK